MPNEEAGQARRAEAADTKQAEDGQTGSVIVNINNPMVDVESKQQEAAAARKANAEKAANAEAAQLKAAELAAAKEAAAAKKAAAAKAAAQIQLEMAGEEAMEKTQEGGIGEDSGLNSIRLERVYKEV